MTLNTFLIKYQPYFNVLNIVIMQEEKQKNNYLTIVPGVISAGTANGIG